MSGLGIVKFILRVRSVPVFILLNENNKREMIRVSWKAKTKKSPSLLVCNGLSLFRVLLVVGSIAFTILSLVTSLSYRLWFGCLWYSAS